ncbi:YlxM family DNA-binding protein [Thermoanaerobacterium sp. DL9XJH110]|uniref:YlxM family DNA-binding protein n=1 Tax=Thermoanaerobacterium sp. DL9XJH110 TaxID=3386643 RepID=UPI003BB7C870
MDNLTRLNLLYDFYSDFLTGKQREIFELHYLNDLSFGEIAENYGITRQGVYDIIHRSQDILFECEEKLGMVKRFLRLEKKVEEILKSLKELEPALSGEYRCKLEKIYDEIASLVKESGE